MSHLTQCNHCTLQSIKAYAERSGQQVFLDTDEDGWTRCYTYKDDPEDRVWCATFVKLTDHCVC